MGAMGNEARLEAGRLCREQTWLDCSLGYPGQEDETLSCQRLSPGRADDPLAGVGQVRAWQQHQLNQLHPKAHRSLILGRSCGPFYLL